LERLRSTGFIYILNCFIFHPILSVDLSDKVGFFVADLMGFKVVLHVWNFSGISFIMQANEYIIPNMSLVNDAVVCNS